MTGKSSCSSVACRDSKSSKTASSTLCGVALSRSILLITTIGLAPASRALRSTKRVCACGPSTESTTNSTPSIMFMIRSRSEEHTSELQSHHDLVCRLLLEKKKKNNQNTTYLYIIYTF